MNLEYRWEMQDVLALTWWRAHGWEGGMAIGVGGVIKYWKKRGVHDLVPTCVSPSFCRELGASLGSPT
jgi:hypothetical protein